MTISNPALCTTYGIGGLVGRCFNRLVHHPTGGKVGRCLTRLVSLPLQDGKKDPPGLRGGRCLSRSFNYLPGWEDLWIDMLPEGCLVVILQPNKLQFLKCTPRPTIPFRYNIYLK